MKVCVFGTRGFPGIQGGVERHGERLYPRFPADCEFIVFRRRPYVRAAAAAFPRIRFVDLPSTRLKGFEAAFHSLLAALACLFIRPDLVHVHNIGPAFWTPLLRLFRLPVVLTYHSPNYEHAKWGPLARTFLRLAERLAFRAANAVIFVNPFQMDKAPAAVRAKAVHLPNGVEPHVPGGPAELLGRLGLEPGRYLLGVGRLTPEKGFDLLIAAFRQVAPPGLKLVLAGGVDNEDSHARALRAQAAGAPVVFTGALDPDDLRPLYEHARLFVLPSRHEGFPLALLEALAARNDVLAADLPAAHLVPLAREDFFAPGDAAELAAKLRHKLAGPPPARAYDLAVFDWARIAAQTREVYARAARP